MNWKRYETLRYQKAVWNPDSFWFNLGSLIFWAVIISIILGIAAL